MIYLLLSCNPKPVPPEPKYVCSADIDWITKPTEPSDVADTESFCDFYQFGWQYFFAQTNVAKNSNERVFELNKAYHPGATNQCSMSIQKGRSQNIEFTTPRIGKKDLEDKQADQRVLYDQNGNILYYNIWYTEEMCKATTEFLPGTMEIKASWRVIEKTETNDYFSIKTDDDEYLGMVGIHFAIWTPKHNEMLWYTYEHRSNAPLCNGSSEVKEYNLASKEASLCLSKKADCSVFNFNVPTKIEGDTPPIKSKPNEICREYHNGNQIKESINGNDNELNGKVIDDLNIQIHEMLKNLPAEHHMSVWQNYKMIGGLWTKDGAESGNLPIANKSKPADANSLQRGSLELTNMTMETFEQGDSSYVPNCFGCHNYTKKDPLNVSHIYKNLVSK